MNGQLYDCVIIHSEPDVPTKRSFVDMLFKLTPEDLGKVVELLNKRCESALDKVHACWINSL